MPDSDPTRSHPPGDPDVTRTGAPAPDPDATLVKPQGQSAPLQPESSGAIVPGFEIEAEIGRGGMGVVYRAKQVGLNRTVALKLLIAGPFVDPSLRARFILEAESVAALEHPNIVKVHAYGDSGGHPFLAMEFLPGGTLADRIKNNGPLSANDATGLVAKLADAVAHAHSRGVVHRDIKPLNVLLAAEGEPRLTDFGLAKVGRADQNLTASNAVLGTPSYMAPERAAGKAHEVGTAADVYALGALLYDVLTGRPPFQGDSAAVTLQKVISEEPKRPRTHNPSIPRDLETICLKCLEKAPERRYTTAQALADDLLSYLRDEPIRARPAGVLERGVKWARRNRGVAGAGAAVSLALVAGTGVSLAFGLEARKQEQLALRREGEAKEAGAREKEAAQRADREKRDAIAARDEALTSLARALVVPLGDGKPDSPLSDYEREAYHTLAARRNTLVGRRLVETASRTPIGSRQLACRAELALHSAVGLDADRRDQIDQLLLALMTVPDTPAERRTNLAIAGARWEGARPVTAKRAAEVLTEALTTAPLATPEEFHEFEELITAWGAAVARLEPPDAVVASRRAADFLVRRLLSPDDQPPWYRSADALAKLADLAPPGSVREQCGQAVRALAPKHPAKGAGYFFEAGHIAALLARSEPRQAVELIADLWKRTGDRTAFAEILAAAAAGLDPEEGERVLSAALREAPGEIALTHLGGGLAAVAAKLPAHRAERACGEAANALATYLARETAKKDWGPWADDHGRMAVALARLAARMKPGRADEAERLCATAAPPFLGKVAGARSTREPLNEVADGLFALAGEMSPREGIKLLVPLWDPDKADPLFTCRSAVVVAAQARRLDPQERGGWCAAGVNDLLVLVEEKKLSWGFSDWAVELTALAAILPPDRAAEVRARAADLLIGTMSDTHSPDDLTARLKALATLTRGLEPAAASKRHTAAHPFAVKVLDDPRSAPIYDEVLDPILAGADPTQARETLNALLRRTDRPLRVCGLASAWRSASLGVPFADRYREAVIRPLVACVVPHPPVSHALALLHAAPPRPRPEPPTPQDLVELLKHPFCVGEARRAVLDALEFTYKRSFKDQWEFVEYVQRNDVHDHTTGQPLDLLTPPKRPEPKP